MDSTLTALGLLMVACVVTLLAHGRRTLLLAIAQGIGIQGVVGACVVAIQVGMLMDDRPPSIVDRVQLAVQGMPLAATGWSAEMARASFPSLSDDTSGGVALIAGVQLLLIGLLFGVRRAQEDERPVDGMQLVLGLLVVTNALVAGGSTWWDQPWAAGQVAAMTTR